VVAVGNAFTGLPVVADKPAAGPHENAVAVPPAVKVTAVPPGLQIVDDVGETVTVGFATTVYAALLTFPPGLVTLITPAVKPAGVTAVIVVLLTTTNEAALTRLKVTEVVPVKFVPVIVTVCPPPAHKLVFGVKEEIVGGENAHGESPI
jgi:hypothetical protein